jgi:hypothetical protein
MNPTITVSNGRPERKDVTEQAEHGSGDRQKKTGKRQRLCVAHRGTACAMNKASYLPQH